MQKSAGAFDYVPSLDGIRAISILLVVFSHFGFAIFPGMFGVTIFFFASGYLITGLLLAELDQTRRLDLRSFYIRRVVRLYPALLVMVAFSALVVPLLGGRVTGGDISAALLYFANYWEWMADGFNNGVVHTSHPFFILWSLSIEEHFYLVFPALCLLLGARKLRFAGVIVGLILAVTLWRLHAEAVCSPTCQRYFGVERGTDTRVDSILYGALLATLLTSTVRERTLAYVSDKRIFALGITLLVAALVIRDPWFRDTWRFALQGVGLFVVIGAVVHAPWLARGRGILGARPAVRLGRWSYSLYLWHAVTKSVASLLLPVALWKPVTDGRAIPPLLWSLEVGLPLILVALALAAASYHFVERPMLRLRRRFGSHDAADATPTEATAGEAAPSGLASA